MKNILLLHGGGPTAVLNASLCGALLEAEQHRSVGKILGAKGGCGGLLRRNFIDLRKLDPKARQLLPFTPGSVIGSSRDHLEPEDYQEIAQVLQQEEIHCLLPAGGNGTMDTAGKIWQACRERGYDIQVIGIPKTMDNDLTATDHAPGYGSAARFIAGSARELAMDIRSLPIHVVILEASGRNAGWVTAAAALAGESDGLGPDLLLFPERPFCREKFLAEVSERLKEKKGLLVVASEGLRDEWGQPVAEPVFTSGRDVYFGDVSGALAQMIQRELGYKARAEKPGLLGRASIAWQSAADREEAIAAGRYAVQSVLEGETGQMVSIYRMDGGEYRAAYRLVPFEAVVFQEKKLPENYISADGFGVTTAFRSYALPLLGGDLPSFAWA